MTNAQYSEIVQSLGNVRASIMNKEMTDEGWDLRDELLALQADKLCRQYSLPANIVKAESQAAAARFDPNIYEDEDD